MSISIRPLQVDDDLDTFGRIVLSAYHALPGHPPDTDYDIELADIRKRVELAMVIGAFDDDEPLGCVTYVDAPNNPFAEHLHEGEATFRMLGVSTRIQGRGVGEALVVACLDQARSAGRRSVFIHSGDWMKSAHRLYGRLGFDRVPTRDWRLDELGILLLAFSTSLD